ncbi:hypothetical protein LCGC14_2024220, partial [marine sediment metagenome]
MLLKGLTVDCSECYEEILNADVMSHPEVDPLCGACQAPYIREFRAMICPMCKKPMGDADPFFHEEDKEYEKPAHESCVHHIEEWNEPQY